MRALGTCRRADGIKNIPHAVVVVVSVVVYGVVVDVAVGVLVWR